MVQKRTLDDDDPIEVSSKQGRQLESDRKLVSVLEFPSEIVFQSTNAPGDNCIATPKTGGDEQLNFTYAESSSVPQKDVESKSSSSLPCSSWAASTTREENTRMESPLHFRSSPDYWNSERLSRTDMHHGEIYSFLLNHPPRKAVPVGPDFQVNIPEWAGHGNQRTIRFSKNMHEASTSQSLNSVYSELLNSEKELSGCCIIPMPESISSAEDWEVGISVVDCACVDAGSIRCVQQHILEERDKLKKTLGYKAFSELGFCNMGEVVTANWSEEEEQLYHEVVYSNPVSSGKNFWDHLAVTFPSKTKKEIVSYYFNVFMLRKRAEQNRFSSMNIDSDDDEWQGTDNSSDNEVEIDEDDSMIDSALVPDRHVSVDEDTYATKVDVHPTAVGFHSMECGGINGNMLNTCPTNVPAKVSTNAVTQIPGSGCTHETGSADINNVLPASDEADTMRGANMEKSDNCKHCTGNLNGTNEANGHDFLLEACNNREWDLGYANCPKNEVDLLPTCSMIEEVFGTGSWNHKARDEHGLS